LFPFLAFSSYEKELKIRNKQSLRLVIENGENCTEAGSSRHQTVSQSHPRYISFLSHTLPPAGYNIQLTVTSVFSFPVSTNILDLTILEFISRTINKKQIKLHTN
jgi:hypothetical protein